MSNSKVKPAEYATILKTIKKEIESGNMDGKSLYDFCEQFESTNLSSWLIKLGIVERIGGKKKPCSRFKWKGGDVTVKLAERVIKFIREYHKTRRELASVKFLSEIAEDREIINKYIHNKTETDIQDKQTEESIFTNQSRTNYEEQPVPMKVESKPSGTYIETIDDKYKKMIKLQEEIISEDHLYPLRALAKEAGLLPIDLESKKGGIILPASKENRFRIYLKADARIDISEELYFELVEQIEKSNLISLRSSPVTATVEGDSITIDPGLIAYIVKM